MGYTEEPVPEVARRFERLTLRGRLLPPPGLLRKKQPAGGSAFVSPRPVLRERVRVRARRDLQKTLTPTLSRSTGRGSTPFMLCG